MRNTLKNIIYIARRFKLATTLNMVGLILAFATFYISMTQILYQMRYNHSLEDYECLYRLESDYVYDEFSNDVCRPFAEALKGVPEVESYSLKSLDYDWPFTREDGSVAQYYYAVGNHTVVSTLTSRVVDGNIEWTDSDSKGIIIPACIAKDYFGTTQATDSVMMCEGVTLTVRGVYEDFPSNSEFKNVIYSNLDNNPETEKDKYSPGFNYNCVIKFKEPPADLDSMTSKIKQAILTEFETEGWDKYFDIAEIESSKKDIEETSIRLTPLKDSYFVHTSFSSGQKGYRLLLYILMLVCLIVIITAMINFLNFTLAESPMRVRGMNTHRVLGASVRSLRLGMIAECVATAVVASLLALALCALLRHLPVTARLTEGSLALGDQWPIALLTVGMSVIVGIIAGTYPAWHATSFAPAMALKGNFGLTTGGIRLRTILVCLQLFVSMLMVIYIGTLLRQSHYIFKSNYGYDKDQILTSTKYIEINDSIKQVLYEDIKNVPGVEHISFSDNLIGSTDGHNVTKTAVNGHRMSYRHMLIDSDYMTTMGIKIIEGRDLQPTDNAIAIINEAAREKWDWLKLNMKIPFGIGQSMDSAIVVGVCEDIRYGTTRMKNHQPFIFIYNILPEYVFLNVRIAKGTDKEQVCNQIDDLLLQRLGDNDTAMVYFDKTLRDTYKDEFRFFQQVYILSIICIIITLIGVFCLTLFETEYRRKEIGIRKVAGATTGEIVGMLCRNYGWLLLMSFAAAVPAAYLFGRLTLEEIFKEKTDIQWWLFPVGLLLVGIVTLGTVALQSWRAARENPVNSIKTE